jgi:hypothetical protein
MAKVLLVMGLLMGCSNGSPGDGKIVADLAAAPNDLASGDLATVSNKIAFVSSMFFSTGDLGGLAGADNSCLSLAEAANLPGSKWVAWLSTSTTNAIDHITGDGPWVTPQYYDIVSQTDRQNPLFANRAALMGDPAGAFNVDETGKLSGARVMTGTAVGGAAIPHQNCADWTDSGVGDNTAYGMAGLVNDGWTNYAGGPGSCNDGGSIYCFQQ